MLLNKTPPFPDLKMIEAKKQELMGLIRRRGVLDKKVVGALNDVGVNCSLICFLNRFIITYPAAH